MSWVCVSLSFCLSLPLSFSLSLSLPFLYVYTSLYLLSSIRLLYCYIKYFYIENGVREEATEEVSNQKREKGERKRERERSNKGKRESYIERERERISFPFHFLYCVPIHFISLSASFPSLIRASTSSDVKYLISSSVKSSFRSAVLLPSPSRICT